MQIMNCYQSNNKSMAEQMEWNPPMWIFPTNSSKEIHMRTCVHAYKLVLERAVNFLGFKNGLRTCVHAYKILQSQDLAEWNSKFKSNWAAYVRTCVQNSSKPRFAWMEFKVQIKLSCVCAYMRTNWFKRAQKFLGFKIWLRTCVHAY